VQRGGRRSSSLHANSASFARVYTVDRWRRHSEAASDNGNAGNPATEHRDVHLSSWIDPNFGLEIRSCGPRRLELFLLHSSTYHHRDRRLCEGRCPRRPSPKIPCKGTDPATGTPLDVGACGMKPVGTQQANLQSPPPPEPVVKGQAVFHTDRSVSITVPETSVGGECVNSFVVQSPVSFAGASIAGQPSNGNLDQPATTSSSISRVQASRARTNTRSRSAAKARPAPAARA
jgi:hypothetical protein